MNLVRFIYPEGRIVPGLQVAERYLWEKDKDLDAEQALRELVRCRLQSSGPTTSSELCLLLNLPQTVIDTALQALQKDGQILSQRQCIRFPG